MALLRMYSFLKGLVLHYHGKHLLSVFARINCGMNFKPTFRQGVFYVP